MADPNQPVSSMEPARRTVGTGPDTDGDGLSDDFETNVFHSNPKERDADGDGLNDWAEYWLDTKPNTADTDGDGWEDGEDLAFGDPLRHNDGGAERAALLKRAREQFEREGSDKDHDLVRDHLEAERGTKKDDPDSDNDGLGDMVELQLRTDPNSPAGSTADLDAARAKLDGRDAPPGPSASTTADDLDTEVALAGTNDEVVPIPEPAYDEPVYEEPSFEATAMADVGEATPDTDLLDG